MFIFSTGNRLHFEAVTCKLKVAGPILHDRSRPFYHLLVNSTNSLHELSWAMNSAKNEGNIEAAVVSNNIHVFNRRMRSAYAAESALGYPVNGQRPLHFWPYFLPRLHYCTFYTALVNHIFIPDNVFPGVVNVQKRLHCMDINSLCNRQFVRQWLLSCDLLLELSRGSASCVLLFIVCTAIHNCSSLGSFSLPHLGSI